MSCIRAEAVSDTGVFGPFSTKITVDNSFIAPYADVKDLSTADFSDIDKSKEDEKEGLLVYLAPDQWFYFFFLTFFIELSFRKLSLQTILDDGFDSFFCIDFFFLDVFSDDVISPFYKLFTGPYSFSVGLRQTVGWAFSCYDLNRSFMRFLYSLPSKGQKSRSNAKTVRKEIFKDLNNTTIPFGLIKVNLGQSFGEDAKDKKAKAKTLASQLIKNKNKSKKNKPVVRSRDKKKSVWA